MDQNALTIPVFWTWFNGIVFLQVNRLLGLFPNSGQSCCKLGNTSLPSSESLVRIAVLIIHMTSEAAKSLLADAVGPSGDGLRPE